MNQGPRTAGIEWNWEWVADGVALVAFVGVLIAIGVRYVERRRLWRAQAEELHSRLAAELARDASIADLAFNSHLSVDADGVTTIEVTGVMPSDAERTRVLHAVQREAARLFPGARVEDALQIDPTRRHAAS